MQAPQSGPTTRVYNSPAIGSIPGHIQTKNDNDDDSLLNILEDNEDSIQTDENLQLAEYLIETKTHKPVRPQSAHSILRPYPTESPEFYMVTMNNPVVPVASQDTPKSSNAMQSRTARPMSARPRLNSNGSKSNLNTPLPPRAPPTPCPSSNGGVRRKRQMQVPTYTSGDGVNTRIRAVYSDVGRPVSNYNIATSLASSTRPTSFTAGSVTQSRTRVFRQSELHDEYYKLVDLVTELRAVVKHEQTKRLKAMSRVRRLEEIVVMKDKKIEKYLHGDGSGVSRFGDPTGGSSALHREMALRERQHNAMIQKSRQKIAQQSQLLASYEEAMQGLRSSIKSTKLVEMEEEQTQLEIEIYRLRDVIATQQEEMQLHGQKLVELVENDAHWKRQTAKLHQEQKKIIDEKRKLEQELMFVKAENEHLQRELAQRHNKQSIHTPIQTDFKSFASSMMEGNPDVPLASLQGTTLLPLTREIQQSTENVAICVPTTASTPSSMCSVSVIQQPTPPAPRAPLMDGANNVRPKVRHLSASDLKNPLHSTELKSKLDDGKLENANEIGPLQCFSSPVPPQETPQMTTVEGYGMDIEIRPVEVPSESTSPLESPHMTSLEGDSTTEIVTELQPVDVPTPQLESPQGEDVQCWQDHDATTHADNEQIESNASGIGSKDHNSNISEDNEDCDSSNTSSRSSSPSNMQSDSSTSSLSSNENTQVTKERNEVKSQWDISAMNDMLSEVAAMSHELQKLGMFTGEESRQSSWCSINSSISAHSTISDDTVQYDSDFTE